MPSVAPTKKVLYSCFVAAYAGGKHIPPTHSFSRIEPKIKCRFYDHTIGEVLEVKLFSVCLFLIPD